MAASIKLFQCIRKCHQIIGIYPRQPNQKQRPINWEKMIFLIGFAEWIIITVGFLAFDAKSMFDGGFILFSITGGINSIFIYFSFLRQLESTLKFIENCERFIEKRVHSTTAYKELIGKIELFNSFFYLAISITSAILYITVAPYSFARYYFFDMGQESFYFFVPAWFPFDWHTPVGYLVAWMIQCVGAAAVATLIAHFLNLIFGSGWLFIFIAEDITHDVTEFNAIVETPSEKNHAKKLPNSFNETPSEKSRTNLVKSFCDLVQIYLDAKQCVNEFNQIIKYSLFAFFSWNLLAISSILVALQFLLWANDSKLFEIILLSFALFWTFIFIFLLCEPGARMTNQYIMYGDEVSRCNWYLLSMEMQRMYLIFLLDTQNPMKVASYVNITCERETFKEIIKTAFSYFMTMRRFRT